MDYTSRMLGLLNAMRRERNGEVADAMRYYGKAYGLNYGVSLPTLRRIAKGEGTDHDFARYLYRQDIREMKLAALWIADPARMMTDRALPRTGNLPDSGAALQAGGCDFPERVPCSAGAVDSKAAPCAGGVGASAIGDGFDSKAAPCAGGVGASAIGRAVDSKAASCAGGVGASAIGDGLDSKAASCAGGVGASAIGDGFDSEWVFWARGIVNSEMAEECAFALMSRMPDIHGLFDVCTAAGQPLLLQYAALLGAARHPSLSASAVSFGSAPVVCSDSAFAMPCGSSGPVVSIVGILCSDRAASSFADDALRVVAEIVRRHPDDRLTAQGAVAVLSVLAQKEENRREIIRMIGSLGASPSADLIHEEIAWRLEA